MPNKKSQSLPREPKKTGRRLIKDNSKTYSTCSNSPNCQKNETCNRLMSSIMSMLQNKLKISEYNDNINEQQFVSEKINEIGKINKMRQTSLGFYHEKKKDVMHNNVFKIKHMRKKPKHLSNYQSHQQLLQSKNHFESLDTFKQSQFHVNHFFNSSREINNPPLKHRKSSSEYKLSSYQQEKQLLKGSNSKIRLIFQDKNSVRNNQKVVPRKEKVRGVRDNIFKTNDNLIFPLMSMSGNPKYEMYDKDEEKIIDMRSKQKKIQKQPKYKNMKASHNDEQKSIKLQQNERLGGWSGKGDLSQTVIIQQQDYQFNKFIQKSINLNNFS